MLSLVVVEGIVILLLGLLVAGLLRSHAEILRRLEALGAGEEWDRPSPRVARSTHTVPLATISGTGPSGAAVSVALSGSRGYTLLAFLSSGCTTCRPFWRHLPQASDPGEGSRLPQDVRPVIVTRGPEGESPAEVAALSRRGVSTVMSTEAWEAFRVPGTPYFQLVDSRDGKVLGEGSAGSWERLGELVARALGDAQHAESSPIPGPVAKTSRPTTGRRLADSDEELRRAGIHPRDHSLHRRPSDGGEDA